MGDYENALEMINFIKKSKQKGLPTKSLEQKTYKLKPSKNSSTCKKTKKKGMAKKAYDVGYQDGITYIRLLEKLQGEVAK